MKRLSEQQRSSLLEHLKDGASLATAARRAGTSKARLRRFADHAQRAEEKLIAGTMPELLDEDESWCLELLIEMELAESSFEQTLVDTIREAGEKEWRASAWLLERRYPDRWGKRATPMINAQGGSTIVVGIDPERLVMEQAKELAAAAAMDRAEQAELGQAPAKVIDVSEALDRTAERPEAEVTPAVAPSIDVLASTDI